MLKNPNYISCRYLIALTGLIFISCANFKAYFNTYYNAEEYFEKAEKIRLENRGEKLPLSADENYGKVIEKTQFVLDNYGEFKLKKSALSLIAQSHFHRGNYRAAAAVLAEMNNEFGNEVHVDVEFWTSLIKWKQNKPQPAINGLNNLIQSGLSGDMEAKVYLAIAEIYLEQEMQSEAMDQLERAAEKIRDPNEIGQIYYRIAALSFDNGVFDRALTAYRQVIKNSQSKKQVQEGHLKTVQIYRFQGDLDLAANSIKNMLMDENYQSIFASLELELAKLYELQNKLNEAKNRLESIVQDYIRTEASAEAYYKLGNYSIHDDWDLEKALKQFGSVSGENRNSLYVKPARMRINEIKSYQQTHLDFAPWALKIAESDTISDSLFLKDEQNEFAKIVYGISELEAFHFGRSDTALVYLDLLIQYASQSRLLPKALYAKLMILNEKGNTETIEQLKKQIIGDFPKTDYALAIIKTDESYKPLASTSDEKLVLAEQNWISNSTLAIDGYREIVNEDTVSESSAKAAYFLAYQYDYHLVQPDSALKYYQWLLKYHIGSDQASHSEKRVTFLNSILADTSETDGN